MKFLGFVSAFLVAASVASAAQPKLPVPPKTTYQVPMKDGVTLATDVYLPPGRGPFPVILARHPYDKNIPTFWAAGFVPKGFAFVIQDTRGRFASQGENFPFVGEVPAEHSDGKATLEWITSQPWCSGKIGTYGQSADSISQFLMVLDEAPGLVCQHLTVGTPSLYDGMAFPGGIFKKHLVEDWLEKHHFDPKALAAWTSHPTYDDFWKARDLRPHFDRVHVPAVHIGGYYDVFSRDMITAFQGYQNRGGEGARGRQKLVMGPWTHGTLRESSGELTFANAKTPPGKMHDPVAWFEQHLMGKDNGIAAEPAVRYYVMGDPADPAAPGKEWRAAAQWPPFPKASQPFYLQSNKTVSKQLPRGGSISFRYDPADPAPTYGGLHLMTNAGSRDQRRIESRPDVLVFDGPVLEKPMEITGDPEARLWISSDCPDTDFFVKLCDVHPDGRSINISEGQLRVRFRDSFEQEKLMKPGEKYELKIVLSPTSIILNKGHRLRVDVTSSNFPGYDPNPNTGAPFRSGPEKRVARNTLHTERVAASRLILPVVE